METGALLSVLKVRFCTKPYSPPSRALRVCSQAMHSQGKPMNLQGWTSADLLGIVGFPRISSIQVNPHLRAVSTQGSHPTLQSTDHNICATRSQHTSHHAVICHSKSACRQLAVEMMQNACACRCQTKCHNACAKAGTVGGSTIAATSTALLALDQAWEDYLNKIRVDNNMACR